MILLDTDVLIEILDRKSLKGDGLLRRVVESGDSVATTSINLHEILYGLQKYGKPLREIALLPTVDYTRRDAELSADIELRAEEKGTLVPRTDTMIAAMTMNRGASLFTLNTRHFRQLQDLGLRLLE